MIAMIGLVSGISCWLVLIKVLKMGHPILTLDIPNHRSLHADPKPSSGGVIVVGVALLVWVLATSLLQGWSQIHLPLLVSILVICAAGWLDDRFEVSIRSKLLVQAAVATIFLWMVEAPLGLLFVPSLLWVVWMINLYNFMDGIDGLVISQTILSSGVLSMWFYLQGDFSTTVLCVCLAGSGVGFFLLNWCPSKIFLGDAGSLALGLIFALLLVRGVQQGIPVLSFLLLHGVFLLDTTITLLMRILSGQNWWEPHTTHLYQLMAQGGMTHSEVTILYMIPSICLAIFSTYQVLHL